MEDTFWSLKMDLYFCAVTRQHPKTDQGRFYESSWPLTPGPLVSGRLESEASEEG